MSHEEIWVWTDRQEKLEGACGHEFSACVGYKPVLSETLYLNVG